MSDPRHLGEFSIKYRNFDRKQRGIRSNIRDWIKNRSHKLEYLIKYETFYLFGIKLFI